MDSDPVELESGKLGCPLCEIPLTNGKTPVYYQGNKMGVFDGIICSVCGYGLLTEKGFKDSNKAIRNLRYATSMHACDKDTEIICKTSISKKDKNSSQ